MAARDTRAFLETTNRKRYTGRYEQWSITSAKEDEEEEEEERVGSVGRV